MRTVCLFIGHVKSGGSLTGAMLDAHPDMAIGDEVDLARLMGSGIDGDAMLLEFARSARSEALKGRVTARRLGGYSLAIEGWSQGSSPQPLVIGNTRPGPTTRLLAEPTRVSAVLDDVLNVFDQRLVFVQIVRRPEDSIAAMVLRSGREIADAARDHRQQCERLTLLRRRLGGSLHTLYYESLVGDCSGTLADLCAFLGVEVDQGYLDACSGLIDTSKEAESSKVEWSAEALEILGGSIEDHDFLARYRG